MLIPDAGNDPSRVAQAFDEDIGNILSKDSPFHELSSNLSKLNAEWSQNSSSNASLRGRVRDPEGMVSHVDNKIKTLQAICTHLKTNPSLSDEDRAELIKNFGNDLALEETKYGPDIMKLFASLPENSRNAKSLEACKSLIKTADHERIRESLIAQINEFGSGERLDFLYKLVSLVDEGFDYPATAPAAETGLLEASSGSGGLLRASSGSGGLLGASYGGGGLGLGSLGGLGGLTPAAPRGGFGDLSQSRRLDTKEARSSWSSDNALFLMLGGITGTAEKAAFLEMVRSVLGNVSGGGSNTRAFELFANLPVSARDQRHLEYCKSLIRREDNTSSGTTPTLLISLQTLPQNRRAAFLRVLASSLRNVTEDYKTTRDTLAFLLSKLPEDKWEKFTTSISDLLNPSSRSTQFVLRLVGMLPENAQNEQCIGYCKTLVEKTHFLERESVVSAIQRMPPSIVPDFITMINSSLLDKISEGDLGDAIRTLSALPPAEWPSKVAEIIQK